MAAAATHAIRSLRHWRVWDRHLPIWYDADYRMPLTAFGKRTGLDPRRADLVTWYLLEWRWITPRNLRSPSRARYEDIARVHTEEYLDSLSRPATLAKIFGVDAWDVPADELMHTIRLGCGGTLAAAREALARRGAAVNLTGGFHHAGPNHGAGLCALNDIAIAVATLRHDGLSGQVVVLDLDAHPPDGTAACLREDPQVWIGSLSSVSSGTIAGVDEHVLPPGCSDDQYLAALDDLVDRMPRPELAFVLAGGDVLAGDHLGHVGMTLDGARRRDLRVARALLGRPSVWLPGGGYHPDAWRVLGGTVLALMRHSRRPIAAGADPMTTRFARLATRVGGTQPDAADTWSFDIEVELGMRARSTLHLLLNTYTANELEYVFYRFGILTFLERRGYSQFRVALGRATTGGERASVYGRADGAEHLLIDCVLDRRPGEDGTELLHIHWLALRDPRARFGDRRPQLPGQDVPGLGVAREATELIVLIARRLELAGVSFNPAWYHTAYVVRSRFVFVDPRRQGRFEALLRDLARVPLVEATRAVAEGRVSMDGAPYAWEADRMVFWLDGRSVPREDIEAERDRVRFTLLPAAAHALPGVRPSPAA